MIVDQGKNWLLFISTIFSLKTGVEFAYLYLFAFDICLHFHYALGFSRFFCLVKFWQFLISLQIDEFSDKKIQNSRYPDDTDVCIVSNTCIVYPIHLSNLTDQGFKWHFFHICLFQKYEYIVIFWSVCTFTEFHKVWFAILNELAFFGIINRFLCSFIIYTLMSFLIRAHCFLKINRFIGWCHFDVIF